MQPRLLIGCECVKNELRCVTCELVITWMCVCDLCDCVCVNCGNCVTVCVNCVDREVRVAPVAAAAARLVD